MTRTEAEDFFYESYLKAEKEWDYDMPDSKKRHPELSRDVIQELSGKHRVPSVHITGSKGKGSVACMIAAVLSRYGKTGLMTSPHILSFNERFQINGKNISDEDFCAYTEKTKSLFAGTMQNLKPGECISPIGLQCALALQFFTDNNTDFNVLEGGKGVRYDDVNNAVHDYAVINTIFLEHTRELGRTLEEIAMDKACIMTGDQKYVYTAEQAENVMEILQKKAAETNTYLKQYGRDFSAENIQYCMDGMLFDVRIEETVIRGIALPLLGEHQAKNCALAMAVCKDILGERFSEKNAKAAMKKLQWPGRMEVLSCEPLTILDASINAKSAEMVIEVLEKMKIPEVTAIIGIPDDKDYVGVAQKMAPLASQIILTKSSSPHYKFSDIQEKTLQERGFSQVCFYELSQALREAQKRQKPILILGTTSLISDVKRIYNRKL